MASVTISSPANGTTVNSPVQLTASVSGQQPSYLYVYDNNSLLLQKQSASSIRTSLTLANGSHTITVVETYGRNSSASASVSITVGSTTSSNSGVANQIYADMTGQNEGYPHGVPLSWDWANGPVIEMGNNSSGWKAIEAWGLAYVASEGSTATNTRVNIRNMQLYFLQKSTNKWLLLQNTNAPTGAMYVEDFSNDTNIPANIRQESDGSISVVPGGGYCFHFYPSNRASIDPNDIGGIVVVYEARLIVANSAKPDDRSLAHFVADAGADYYPGLQGNCPVGDNGGCPGVAIGKMKYVQNNWRSYAMTTMTKSALSSNPPPIDLTGASQ